MSSRIFFLRTVAQCDDGDNRSDTDDDAEHGQKRTHFVRQYCLYRHSEGFDKLVVIKRPRGFFLNPPDIACGDFGIFRGVGNDFAVPDFDDAVGIGGNAGVVRDHNDGMPGFVQPADDFHHIFAAGGIECAGRLVGEDDFSAVHQGAGDGDALLLSAREFAGLVALFTCQTQILQEFVRPRGTLFASHTHIHGWQRDVVPCGQRA